MVDIGNNFGRNQKCVVCEEREKMSHIYECKYLNTRTKEISFEKIYTGNIFQQIKVLRIFQENMKRRNEKLQNNDKNIPCDPLICDPLPTGRIG